MSNRKNLKGVDGIPMSDFQMRNAATEQQREWICKKCGLKRSNKKTHIHGVPL